MHDLSRAPLTRNGARAQALGRKTVQCLRHFFITSSIPCNEVVSFFRGHDCFSPLDLFGITLERSISDRAAGYGHEQGGNFALVHRANSLVLCGLNRDAPMTPWCLPSEPPACQFSSTTNSDGYSY